MTGILATVVHGPRRPARAGALLGACACAAALAAGAGGCGSGGGGTPNTADPATAVPAGSAVFLGADVRPDGAEKQGALAAGEKLAHQPDPYVRLLGALQTPGSAKLDFGRDVAPWLGKRAGVFLSSLASVGALEPIVRTALLGASGSAASFPFGAHGAQGALVLDASDTARAHSFLESQAAHAGATPTSYRGVAYRLSPAGIAFGLVKGFAVIGSDSALHGVVDTAQGGPSLARAPGYSKLAGVAPQGALAHIYVNPTLAGPSRGGEGAGLLALLAGARESNISAVVAGGALTLFADSRVAAGAGTPGAGTPGGLLAAGAEGARALEGLPGESWLAVGLAHLGTTLSGDAAGLRELVDVVKGAATTPAAGTGNGVVNLNEVLEGLLGPLRAIASESPQSRSELTGWMGSGGIFASGSGLLELKAAVVIESNDPARSRAAVAKLGALLAQAGDEVEKTTLPGTDAAIGVKVHGLPVVLYLADGHDAAGHTKLVLALGEDSVNAALSPTSTMASASATSTAASTLGEGTRPSIVLDTPTLYTVLEALGLPEDPTLGQATRVVRALGTVAGGGHDLGGGTERFKLVVGLR